jgi:predicted RNase H-like nuclease (RuvC/YqgF family)
MIMELESRNQLHNKTIAQLQDGWHREELKLKNTINELKEQLSRSKSEAQELTMRLDSLQRTHHAEETQLQMDIQNYERQLQSKNEKLSEALQKIADWGSLGVSRLYLQFLDLSDLEQIELIGSEIIPHL